jgi:type IV secretory pathway TrbF-like protein
MHTDDEQAPHWRACGLLCMVLGVLAAGWLVWKYKGRLFR